MGVGKSVAATHLNKTECRNYSNKDGKIRSEDIFNVQLVSDCIFNNLPTPDILSCSIVCKNWNAASREYLWQRRHCLLRIFPGEINNLKEVLLVLENRKMGQNYPFKGVYCFISPYDGLFQFPCSNLEGTLPKLPRAKNPLMQALHWRKRATVESCFKRILAITTAKHIVLWPTNSIRYYAQWDIHFLLESLPLEEVQSLKIKDGVYIPWEKYSTTLNSNVFSNLKIIEMNYQPGKYHDYRRMEPEAYETILCGCPALEELKMAVEANSMQIFDAYDKLFLIKWLLLGDFQGLLLNNGTLDDKPFSVIQKSAGICLNILSVEKQFWELGGFTNIMWILGGNLNKVRELKLRGGYNYNIFDLNSPPWHNVEKIDVYDTLSSEWYEMVGRNVVFHPINSFSRVTVNHENNDE